MKQLKHPATVIAALALFVGLAGGAYASGLINGSQIKNHSVAESKLTKAAVKSLRAPSSSVFSYTATPSASPTFKAVGTVLGDTLYAACGTSSGSVELGLEIQTAGGSWFTDLNSTAADNGTAGSTFISSEAVPAGSLTSPQSLGGVTANAGHVAEVYIDFLQTKPMAGSMVWYVTADANANACRFSLQGNPAAFTAVAGAPHKFTKLHPVFATGRR